MRLIDVIFGNLRRRKGRKLLLVTGLAIGVASIVTLVAVTEAMREDVATSLDEYGANILIVPRANDLSLSYGGVTVGTAAFDVAELSTSDLDRLSEIKNARNISVVSPKLLGAMPVRDRTVLVAGVRFVDELRLKQWWAIAGEEPSTARDALVGPRLADVLGLAAGDDVQLNGRAFRVSGVLAENGSQDDDILFIDLAEAQQLMRKPNGISLVEVAALCTDCPVEEMVVQIAGVLPQARVTALREAVTLRMETVAQLGQFALAVSAVVAIIGAMVVLTTMLGAVAERRQEIGLFRALGFRQGHLMRIILGEAALLSFAGGLFGWLLGMLIAIVAAQRVAGVAAAVGWSPWLAVVAVGGALGIGVLASLYPAVNAARLNPTTALRSL